MTQASPSLQSPHAIIVSNGALEPTERLLALVDGADLVLAADGGANWLAAHGRLPHVLVGDMDSVHPDVLRALEMGHCRVVRHPAAKDQTDTELALHEALTLSARRITLLGAWGGRMDHALANVLLLTMPLLAGIDVALFDGVSTARLVRRALTLSGEPGDVLSLLPLDGPAVGVTTHGLEYALHDDTLAFGPARGISNLFVDAQATITVRSGLLLAVHTQRRHLEPRA